MTRSIFILYLVLNLLYAVGAQTDVLSGNDRSNGGQDDTVYLRVSVLDRKGVKFDPSLDAADFTVKSKRKEYEITSFSVEQGAMTFGFLLDVSSSMKDKNNSAKAAAYLETVKDNIRKFIESAHPENEYFIVLFAKDVAVLSHPTQDKQSLFQVLDSIEFPNEFTTTSLVTAVEKSLEIVETSKFERQNLIIISDGQETSRSSNTQNDLKDRSQKYSGLVTFQVDPIYISTTASNRGASLENARMVRTSNYYRVLDPLIESGGGQYFPVQDEESIAAALGIILMRSNAEYRIGFAPAVLTTPDYKKLSVSVRSRQKNVRYSVFAPKGYYR